MSGPLLENANVAISVTAIDPSNIPSTESNTNTNTNTSTSTNTNNTSNNSNINSNNSIHTATATATIINKNIDNQLVEYTNTTPNDEALIDSIILWQRKVFAKQLELYEIFSKSENMMHLTSASITYNIPDILIKKRANAKSCILDNEDFVVMDILDANGILSLPTRLSEFMMLMTRVTKIDHRAICLHILKHKIHPNCAKLFVKRCGLRLLKHWLKTAEECDCISELSTIVSICKSLPFDSIAIKDSEIGKSIKKLLKYKSPSNTNTSVLQQEVKDLMSLWTELLSKPALVDNLDHQMNPNEQHEQHEQHETIHNFPLLTHLITTPKQEITYDTMKISSNLNHVIPLEKSVVVTNLTKDTNGNVIVKPSISTSTSIVSNVDEVKVKTIPVVQLKKPIKSTLEMLQTNNLSSTNKTITSNPSNVIPLIESKSPTSATGIAIPAIPTTNFSNMTSNTMSWLKSKTNDVNSSNSLTSSLINTKRIGMAEEARKQLEFHAMNNSNGGDKNQSNENEPLRSCLKRKSIEISKSNELLKNKKLKSNIQWADENGMTLKEIFTFEVEKIRTAVASYKSHKDLVKREKQLEKDLHMSKVHDAMQKTVDWKEPQTLQLSIDIQDILNTPINSLEVITQLKRLSTMIETRYLDDSLIPSEPDELLTVLNNAEGTNISDICISIPWNLPGAIEAPVPVASLELPNANHKGFDSLPECLRSMDPQFLALLLQDESLLMYILNVDGSVNEEKLQLLQYQYYPQQQYENGFQVATSQPSNLHQGYNNTQPIEYHQANQMYSNNVPYQQTIQNSYQPMNSQLPYFDNTVQQQAMYQQPIQVPQNFQAPSKPPPMNNRGKMSNHKKGTIACRLFLTPEGCKFGDTCDFSHDFAQRQAIFGVPIATNKPRVGINRSNKGGPGARSFASGFKK